MSHVHLIGIGGSGLSAIARVLLESGYSVSGSDRQSSPVVSSLEQAGARISIGHHPENVAGADLVIRSSAIPDENMEVQAARLARIPVYKRADFLGQLMSGKTGIAVAGSHGKTTTTAMIAWILSALGQDPTYIIGGVSLNLGVNAHAGQGQTFVIEADEYDRMFLGLQPRIAVVLNVEHDHPDCYPTPEDYDRAFVEFAARLPADGILLVCQTDPGSARLLNITGRQVVGYGIPLMNTSSPSEQRPWMAYEAVNLAKNESGGFGFDVRVNLPPAQRHLQPGQEKSLNDRIAIRVNLQIPGEHNVNNALAALAVADLLSLDLEGAARALAEYRGTGRRFEVLGEVGGVVIINDYAHHPTQIRATLAAARSRYPGRSLWAVWQPHTYSRTRSLFYDFASSFTDADHVIVTDVYAAREPAVPNFSARQLVATMDHPDVHYAENLDRAANLLLSRLHPGNVLLVLSAGDADQVSSHVLAALKERIHANA